MRSWKKEAFPTRKPVRAKCEEASRAKSCKNIKKGQKHHAIPSSRLNAGPQLNGFPQMGFIYFFGFIQVSNGSGDLDDSVVASCTEPQRRKIGFQHLFSALRKGTKSLHFPTTHTGIAELMGPSEPFLLPRPGGNHALSDSG